MTRSTPEEPRPYEAQPRNEIPLSRNGMEETYDAYTIDIDEGGTSTVRNGYEEADALREQGGNA